MIALGEGMSLSPCLRSIAGPFEDRFFVAFSGRFCREEHVQESVLVSTLKRRSALLTLLKINPGELPEPSGEAALLIGTVPVARLSGDKESPQA